VIFAEIGSAVAADAIFHDADTIHIETANDRAARCAWRVGRAGDAGLVVQKIAERGAALRRISSLGTTVTVAN
jgi:hypothetical protein